MEQLTLSVLKVLSGIALVLAVVGLFSVLAYAVDRRMSEFGVRIALGATPRDLARLVLRRGMMLAAVGVAAGTAGALGLTRFLQSLLFETAPFDPLVYLAVAAVLLAAAAASCWIPPGGRPRSTSHGCCAPSEARAPFVCFVAEIPDLPQEPAEDAETEGES